MPFVPHHATEVHWICKSPHMPPSLSLCSFLYELLPIQLICTYIWLQFCQYQQRGLWSHLLLLWRGQQSARIWKVCLWNQRYDEINPLISFRWLRSSRLLRTVVYAVSHTHLCGFVNLSNNKALIHTLPPFPLCSTNVVWMCLFVALQITWPNLRNTWAGWQIMSWTLWQVGSTQDSWKRQKL